MAKERNKPSNKEDQPVQFRRRDAQRIGNAVHSHETGRRGRNPSSLPRAAGGGGGGGEGASLVTATFSGTWFSNSDKVIYLTASPSTATAVVNNALGNITGLASLTPRKAIIAQIGNGYVLVNYEC